METDQKQITGLKEHIKKLETEVEIKNLIIKIYEKNAKELLELAESINNNPTIKEANDKLHAALSEKEAETPQL